MFFLVTTPACTITPKIRTLGGRESPSENSTLLFLKEKQDIFPALGVSSHCGSISLFPVSLFMFISLILQSHALPSPPFNPPLSPSVPPDTCLLARDFDQSLVLYIVSCTQTQRSQWSTAWNKLDTFSHISWHNSGHWTTQVDGKWPTNDHKTWTSSLVCFRPKFHG